jgi:S-adenosylmethionine/arginine decarboxylase-like enzyme
MRWNYNKIISHAHNMTWWGSEFIADCGGCDLALISDAENIRLFSKELVEKIKMVAYGEPQIVHFGSEDKAGYTLVQLIETSNITAHYSEDTCSFFLNVFGRNEGRYENAKTLDRYYETITIYVEI